MPQSHSFSAPRPQAQWGTAQGCSSERECWRPTASASGMPPHREQHEREQSPVDPDSHCENHITSSKIAKLYINFTEPELLLEIVPFG